MVPHPLATLSVVLGAAGFVVLPIIGGLVGAAAGVGALRAIERDPQRWAGRNRARVGVGLGFASGVVMVTIFAMVRHDDWGSGPLVAAIAYAGTLGALSVPVGSLGARVRAAVLASGAVVAVAVVVIGVVLAVAFMLETIVRGLVT